MSGGSGKLSLSKVQSFLLSYLLSHCQRSLQQRRRSDLPRFCKFLYTHDVSFNALPSPSLSYIHSFPSVLADLAISLASVHLASIIHYSCVIYSRRKKLSHAGGRGWFTLCVELVGSSCRLHSGERRIQEPRRGYTHRNESGVRCNLRTHTCAVWQSYNTTSKTWPFYAQPEACSCWHPLCR